MADISHNYTGLLGALFVCERVWYVWYNIHQDTYQLLTDKNESRRTNGVGSHLCSDLNQRYLCVAMLSDCCYLAVSANRRLPKRP